VPESVQLALAAGIGVPLLLGGTMYAVIFHGSERVQRAFGALVWIAFCTWLGLLLGALPGMLKTKGKVGALAVLSTLAYKFHRLDGFGFFAPIQDQEVGRPPKALLLAGLALLAWSSSLWRGMPDGGELLHPAALAGFACVLTSGVLVTRGAATPEG
jgi:hypothetical protein